MPQLRIERHARERMTEREVTLDDIAHIWVHYERDRTSQEHPSYRVREGHTPAGVRVGVVARATEETFDIKTVW